MKNKYLILALIFCILYIPFSCKKEVNHTKSIEINSLKLKRDSVVSLIIDFQMNNDTNSLLKGLELNDEILRQDNTQENKYYDYSVRAQILNLLGKYKEAFLLEDKIITNDKNNINRIIYQGLIYRFQNKNDSADFYFSVAHRKCDSLLNINYDFEIIINKLKIYVYQKNKIQAEIYIDSLLLDNPKNLNYQVLHENFNEMYEVSKVLDNIIL